MSSNAAGIPPILAVGSRRNEELRYIQGGSTRSVDDVVRAMGMSGISKSQVNRLCEKFDERIHTLPGAPDRGRLALCLGRRHLCEGAPERTIVSVA